jgi:two-component SAPR family response regulator
LAQRVRELRPDIRVLYMSGHTEDSIAQSGLLEPGALLISKPFTQESLARKVREALGPRPREQG